MTDQRKKELARLLRRSRQRVFDDSRYERIIMTCKRRLGYDQEDYRSPGGEAYARVMWM
jgi:hypothetical protein